ncbi:MAG TPA: Uma2 family endonuclease [Ktedonobacteraceae bacterium]|jgi:Uma2 family endonuclease|nr:Uma2 family endonuclease [Ktedonobacteraceae bacterium]
MSALPFRSTMSVEEYLALDRNSFETRYEYIDGQVYMLAGGTANHSIIKVNTISLLRTLLRGSPCHVYDSDMRVRVSETRYVYPDASVSCDSRDIGEIDILHSPRLVVEVLSPSTEARDRRRKLGYYRACPTIQEYMLVDTHRQAVDLHRRRGNLWVLSSFGPGQQVELESLNVHFPVSALYEDVILPEES